MLAETQDNEEIIERVAALDIGKAGLVCCVRVPREDRPGRLQEGGDVLHDDPAAAGHG
jgi:transposase